MILLRMAWIADHTHTIALNYMFQPTDLPDQIFSLSPKIRVLPVVNGSGNMAQIVRDVMVSRTCDCLAVPLPHSAESLVQQAVEALPVISIVVLPEVEPSPS